MFFAKNTFEYFLFNAKNTVIAETVNGRHGQIICSSLLKLNDGDADLSRRIVPYQVPGLSYREYLLFERDIRLESTSLQELLKAPNAFCSKVKSVCKPLESFNDYLKHGYYPFYFESRNTYPIQVENVIDYIINVELTQLRSRIWTQ